MTTRDPTLPCPDCQQIHGEPYASHRGSCFEALKAAVARAEERLTDQSAVLRETDDGLRAAVRQNNELADALRRLYRVSNSVLPEPRVEEARRARDVLVAGGFGEPELWT